MGIPYQASEAHLMSDQAEERLIEAEQNQQGMQSHIKSIMEMLTKISAASPSGEAMNQGNAPVPPTVTTPPDAMQGHDLPNQNRHATIEVLGSPTPTQETPLTRFQQLEARMRVVEGNDVYGATDPRDLCLVQDFELPPKFKVPDFEKYNGFQCPKEHLTMYCRKMATHIGNDKLLIHCFQDSLTEGALRWYNQLESSQIKNWRDLATLFLNHYKHVMYLSPDRTALQALEMKPNESFRNYALRWREMAMDIRPPLLEREFTTLFINSLKGVYYKSMVGNVTGSFASLLTSGERIENAIKEGKFEEDAIEIGSSQMVTSSPSYTSQKNQNQHRINRRKIEPVPMPYADLYSKLKEAGKLGPEPPEKRRPPYPSWYKPEDQCEYHSGEVGHHIESCMTLKRAVQALRRAKQLTFSTHGELLID